MRIMDRITYGELIQEQEKEIENSVSRTTQYSIPKKVLKKPKRYKSRGETISVPVDREIADKIKEKYKFNFISDAVLNVLTNWDGNLKSINYSKIRKKITIRIPHPIFCNLESKGKYCATSVLIQTILLEDLSK